MDECRGALRNREDFDLTEWRVADRCGAALRSDLFDSPPETIEVIAGDGERIVWVQRTPPDLLRVSKGP